MLLFVLSILVASSTHVSGEQCRLESITNGNIPTASANNASFVDRVSLSGNTLCVVENEKRPRPPNGTAKLFHIAKESKEVVVPGTTFYPVKDAVIAADGTILAMAMYDNPEESNNSSLVRVLERSAQDNQSWVQRGDDVLVEENVNSVFLQADGKILGVIMVDSIQLYQRNDTSTWAPFGARFFAPEDGTIAAASVGGGDSTLSSGDPGQLYVALVRNTGFFDGGVLARGFGDIFSVSPDSAASWKREYTFRTTRGGHWSTNLSIDMDADGTVVAFGFARETNQYGVNSGFVHVVTRRTPDGARNQTLQYWKSFTFIDPGPFDGHDSSCFGCTVSLSESGEWLVVGSKGSYYRGEDWYTADNGAVYLYHLNFDERTWCSVLFGLACTNKTDLVGKVFGDHEEDEFGAAVALSDNILVGGTASDSRPNYIKLMSVDEACHPVKSSSKGPPSVFWWAVLVVSSLAIDQF